MEGIDACSSNRLFVRILLKEGFCVLYMRRDVVSLIWSEVEVLHFGMSIRYRMMLS